MKEKILVIRLSALGDVIFALPTLSVICENHPDASISWLVEDKASTLLMHRKDLDRVIVYPRKEIKRTLGNPFQWFSLLRVLWRHLKALRQERYDCVFDFQGNLKSGIHAWLTRSPLKIGYDRKSTKEGNTLFTHRQVPPPGHAIHRIEKSFSLVKPEFKPEEIRRPDICLPEALVAEARDSVKEWLEAPKRLLIIHPGTSAFGAFKRWAPENYGCLAKRMRKEMGFQSLVTWGPDEKPLAQAVCESGGEGVVLCPPTRSLLHLAAFISLGDAYVSADSGPLHLANYLAVPCLALFGPKDPALYRPYFPPSRVARSKVDCSPCTRRQCDDPICMKNLTVDEVYEALRQLIEASDR